MRKFIVSQILDFLYSLISYYNRRHVTKFSVKRNGIRNKNYTAFCIFKIFNLDHGRSNIFGLELFHVHIAKVKWPHMPTQTLTSKLFSVKRPRVNKVAFTHLSQWRSSVPVHCVTSPRGGGYHCSFCPCQIADGDKEQGGAQEPRCTGDLE